MPWTAVWLFARVARWGLWIGFLGFMLYVHVNRAALLTVERPLDRDQLARMAAALVAHHPALRLRFRAANGAFVQRYGGPADSVAVESCVLAAADDDTDARRANSRHVRGRQVHGDRADDRRDLAVARELAPGEIADDVIDLDRLAEQRLRVERRVVPRPSA